MNRPLPLSIALAALLPLFAQAQDHSTHVHTSAAEVSDSSVDGDDAKMDHSQMDHSQMDHSQMDHSQMDHSKMDHSKMDHSKMDHSKMDHSKMDHSKMDHSKMDHSKMDHSKMDHHSQGEVPRTPLPVLTEADHAAAFPTLKAHSMHHASRNSYILLDRLEGWDADRGSGQAWEANAWYGGDIHRLWLRSEGERSAGRTESSQLEALYGRAISPWWDLLVGIRQDFRPTEGRTWAALGVQGLAPYKFEVAATLYFGEQGTSALGLEAEYDVLLTNRLILQPRLEADIAFARDRARNIGSGLDSVEAGVRLRYEITRQIAPYLGWVHERRFGDSADWSQQHGDDSRDSRFVAGLRLWW